MKQTYNLIRSSTLVTTTKVKKKNLVSPPPLERRALYMTYHHIINLWHSSKVTINLTWYYHFLAFLDHIEISS